MADPNALVDGLKLAGTAVGGLSLTYIVGQFVAGLLKSWTSGTGAQEKELRTDLAAECARLSADLTKCRDEIDELRRDMRQMNRMYLHQYSTREKARGMVNTLEKLAGTPETVWPVDPPEELNSPAGGTP